MCYIRILSKAIIVGRVRQNETLSQDFEGLPCSVIGARNLNKNGYETVATSWDLVVCSRKA